MADGYMASSTTIYDNPTQLYRSVNAEATHGRHRYITNDVKCGLRGTGDIKHLYFSVNQSESGISIALGMK